MFKIPIVKAHCDIPCKIYDPAVAQVAAVSIVRLMDLMADVNSTDQTSGIAQISRLIAQKETHSAGVKHEVVTIWGDYFKAPQIKMFPSVHSLAHSIMMTASRCKQGHNRQDGLDLLEQLNEFTEMFWHSKDIKTRRVVAPYPPALELVQPVLADV